MTVPEYLKSTVKLDTDNYHGEISSYRGKSDMFVYHRHTDLLKDAWFAIPVPHGLTDNDYTTILKDFITTLEYRDARLGLLPTAESQSK